MLEVYYEQNVTLENENQNKNKKIIFKIISYVNLAIGFFMLMFIGFFIRDAEGNWAPPFTIVIMIIIPVIFIVSYFLIKRFVFKINTEFDYILNGKKFIIIKIFNKIRRKKFLEFDVNDFSEIGKVTLPAYEQHMGGKPKEINACVNLNDDNFYVVARHNGEKVMLYTEFSEEMLASIYRAIGRNIYKKK